MKKYFLGWTAIVFAIAFSAFTKPFSMVTYKLSQDPVSANIVNNPARWVTNGSFYGECVTLQNDIACKIKLESAQSGYFHTVYENKVLNTYIYAYEQNPKQNYLEITETDGLGSNRIISSITAKRWEPFVLGGGMYVTVDLGSDLGFTNAKD
jgi:hypothetical protein